MEEAVIERCALCAANLKDLSIIDKTIDSNNPLVYIQTFTNYKYKHKDYYYFACHNNPIFH